MKRIKYYIPLKQDNLAFYLSSAAFAPANFYANRGNDVQSIYANRLLLSTTNLVGDSDCCIEIQLTESEKRDLTLISGANDVFLYNGFFPASRIVAIFFNNQRELECCRTNINHNTAILQDSLCRYEQLEKSKFDLQLKNVETQTDTYENYLTYQRVLGGLALMRTVNEGQYTYSLDYLPFVAKYNEQIRIALANVNIEPNIEPFTNKELLEGIKIAELAVDKKKDEYTRLIKNIALREGLQFKEKASTHTIEYSLLKGNSLILSYLRDYKVDDQDVGGRMMIDSLISKRFEDIQSASLVAFYYGYSRGYYRFAKKYESVEYKYDFLNRLDCYVIETIYQLALKVNKSNQFEYIDTILPSLPQHILLNDGEYVVLGQKIVGKKKAKVGSQEWFEQFYQSLQERCSILFEGFESSIAPSLLSTILNNVRTLVQKAIDFTLESIRTQCEELIQNHKDELVHLREEHWAEIEKLSKESEKNERKIRGEYSLLLADVDKSLFDRIDTDGDGILSYEEVTEFTRVLISIHDEAKKMQASNDESLSINNADVAETTEQTPKEELKDNEQDNAAPDISSEVVGTVDGTSDSTDSTDSQTVNKTVEDSKEDNADNAFVIEDLAPQTTIDESSEEASCIESTDSEAITDEVSTDITQETSEIISTEALPNNNVDKKEQSNTTNIQTSLSLD